MIFSSKNFWIGFIFIFALLVVSASFFVTQYKVHKRTGMSQSAIELSSPTITTTEEVTVAVTSYPTKFISLSPTVKPTRIPTASPSATPVLPTPSVVTPTSVSVP